MLFKVDQFRPNSDGTFLYSFALSGANTASGKWLMTTIYDAARLTVNFTVRQTSIELPIVISDIQLTDISGAPVPNIRVGSQSALSLSTANLKTTPQSVVIILQIERSDGSTEYLSWQTSTIGAGQSMNSGFGWTPTSVGQYKVKVFAWQAINNPVPLADPSILNISVNDSADTETGLPGYNQTVVSIGDVRLLADIAATPGQKSLGLGVRHNMTEAEGMLFPFDMEAPHGFWMSGMKFPIDIIWLDADKKVVHIEPNLQPCTSTLDCPTYSPEKNALYVLETVAGFSERHNVTIGTQTEFEV